MARRMFSDEITTSDAFLDMPIESQLVYFHLGMQADDDGFISNIKMVQRVIGASDDSVKILFVKKFLLQFENGVCVIKHWKMNNFIRKDIYRETKYIKEKSSLFIRENGSYTTNPNNALPVPRGHFTIKDEYKNNPVNGTSTARQLSIGKVRIDKDRIGKVRIGKKKDLPKELPDWLDKTKWSEWLEFRKQLRKPMTEMSITRQLNLLSENKEDHIQIIENSITNGWTGLFPLKDTGKANLDKSTPYVKGKYKDIKGEIVD